MSGKYNAIKCAERLAISPTCSVGCGNDLVNDTPTHNTSNFGCPSYPHRSTCSGTPVEMTMNYTDDACMYMFTTGQKQRASAIYVAGGARASYGD